MHFYYSPFSLCLSPSLSLFFWSGDMGVLKWVHNKLGGKQEKRRSDAVSIRACRSLLQNERKEEFCDWPQALLAIGTLGTNNNLKQEEPQIHESRECSKSSNYQDFALEEVAELQNELKKLLTRKSKLSMDGSDKGGGANLPLNRFLNCLSSWELDRGDCNKLFDDVDDNDYGGDLSPNRKIILSKANDIFADKCKDIKQKSFSFLLKKMFACRSGFAPSPSLRDPLSESRTKKLLRMILHKNIYPQNPASSSTKRYLEKKSPKTLCLPDKGEEKGENCKWVNTDSEYIVLEI